MKLIDQDFQEFSAIKNVLLEKAKNDNVFKEKLENNTALFSEFKEYLYQQAQKINITSSCVAVEDTVVFGWAIHFIDEEFGVKREIIEEEVEEVENTVVENKKQQPVKIENKKKEKDENQMSIFDFL